MQSVGTRDRWDGAKCAIDEDSRDLRFTRQAYRLLQPHTNRIETHMA
jgi:hypothetical protein